MANCAAPPVARDTCGTALENQISKPYGPVSAGLVAPHNETTGVPRAGGDMHQTGVRPDSNMGPRYKTQGPREAMFGRPDSGLAPNNSSKLHPRSVGLPYHPTKSPRDYGFSRENPRNRPSDAETSTYSASEFRRTTQRTVSLFCPRECRFFLIQNATRWAGKVCREVQRTSCSAKFLQLHSPQYR